MPTETALRMDAVARNDMRRRSRQLLILYRHGLWPLGAFCGLHSHLRSVSARSPHYSSSSYSMRLSSVVRARTNPHASYIRCAGT